MFNIYMVHCFAIPQWSSMRIIGAVFGWLPRGATTPPVGRPELLESPSGLLSNLVTSLLFH